MKHAVLALDDWERLARDRLPRPVFGYIATAAETGSSFRANRSVWDEWRFVPRTVVDVRGRTAQTELFGKSYAAPFGIAPMGGIGMAAYRGDIALARAAEVAQVPLLVSAASLIRLEEIRAEGSTCWFQAYVGGDAATIDQLADRVASAGFDTLCVTADVPLMGNRENQLRCGFEVPMRPSARLFFDALVRPRWLAGCFLRTIATHGLPHYENMGARVPVLSSSFQRAGTGREGLTWAHLARLRHRWKGTLVLKGLLSPHDVREARGLGMDGVIASNHGGRQLDGAVHPIEV